MVVDAAGQAIAAGRVDSFDFPTTPGVFNGAFQGRNDILITKLAADGSTLVFSGLIGSSNDDSVEDIILDSGGNILITGKACSTDFPTTPGAFDRTYDGNDDAYIAKISADGSTLMPPFAVNRNTPS